jgi:hypothetical protein
LDSGPLSAVGLRRTVLAATKTALTHEESSAVQSLAAPKLWCDEFDSIYRWAVLRGIDVSGLGIGYPKNAIY